MNLIQIQEHLKDLPTQAIMAYANGKNPEVPPYMALGEMNRRKNMEQRAAQAPDSSVKEKLESELNQQLALPGIGQGMNMRINPAGMPQPVPAAQPQMAPPMPKMDNPALALSMPPQQMSQPGQAPGMAGGGLATLPVDPDMFNYAPGGIVAFADEDNNQLVLPPGTPYSAEESGTYSDGQMGGIDKLPVALANKILAQRLQGDNGVAEPVNKDDIRKKIAAENPELGAILSKLPGDALSRLATQLEAQNAAQRDRFQQGEGRRGLAALSNALIAAGEATRGQKGSGLGAAFGGFGKAYNQSTAEAEDRAAKQQAIERAQTIETIRLQSDIDNMKRAYAEGRVADAQQYEKDIRARQQKIAEMQGAAAKDTLTQYMTQQQRDEQARHNKQIEKYQQTQANAAAERAQYERENRPTKEDKNILAVMTRLNNDPDYKSLLKKRENYNPGDPEFDAIQDVLDSMRDAAYKDLKLTAPTKRDRLKPTEKPEEKGFFANLFGGSSPTNTKAVPFDKLPD